MPEIAATIPVDADISRAIRTLNTLPSHAKALVLKLDDRSFTGPLGSIRGGLQQFNKALDASNARVISFGASAGILYSFVRAFTSIARSTIDVHKSLTEIGVVLNTSTEGLSKFGNSLFDIAKNTGQSFKIVSQAALELSRQGLSVEETLKRTRDALILTRFTNLDAASSVEALTTAINSFDKAALTSTQIVNKLFNVDTQFAVSSRDLAEALSRVGSTAQDAGVGIDSLIGLVTSAKQITGRDGPVIGNSLKTIFQRLQRPEVLSQLEKLGVLTKDVAGNLLPVDQILISLARTYDTLAQSQQNQVTQLAAGVFQANIFKALLNDLAKANSVYTGATNASTNATNQAIQRNQELNKTLSALVNETFVNLTKAGANIGKDAFEPLARRGLSIINALTSGFNFSEPEGFGEKIGSGILKGIGSFLAGPGAIAILAILGRLTFKFTKDIAKDIGDLTGLNRVSQERANIEKLISGTLSNQPALMERIKVGQLSVLDAEKAVLNILNQELVLRERLASVSTVVAKSAIAQNILRSSKNEIIARIPTQTTPSQGTIPPKRASEGFIPNFALPKKIFANKSKIGVPGFQTYSISGPEPMFEFVDYNRNAISNYATFLQKTKGIDFKSATKEAYKIYGISNPENLSLRGGDLNLGGIKNYNKGFIPNIKKSSEIISTVKNRLIGVVDRGEVRAVRERFDTARDIDITEHAHAFGYSNTFGRWRYNPEKKIINWTTTPTQEEKELTENYLLNRGAELAENPHRGVSSKIFNSGLIPIQSSIKEKLGAYQGGYTPGQVKETNIKGLGKVIYNTAEKIKQFPGLEQPAIIPPKQSKAGINYKEKFKTKHGFDPYMNKGLVPNYANLFYRGTQQRYSPFELNEQGVLFASLDKNIANEYITGADNLPIKNSSIGQFSLKKGLKFLDTTSKSGHRKFAKIYESLYSKFGYKFTEDETIFYELRNKRILNELRKQYDVVQLKEFDPIYGTKPIGNSIAVLKPNLINPISQSNFSSGFSPSYNKGLVPNFASNLHGLKLGINKQFQTKSSHAIRDVTAKQRLTETDLADITNFFRNPVLDDTRIIRRQPSRFGTLGEEEIEYLLPSKGEKGLSGLRLKLAVNPNEIDKSRLITILPRHGVANEGLIPNYALSFSSLKKSVQLAKKKGIFFDRKSGDYPFGFGSIYNNTRERKYVNIPKGTEGEIILHELGHVFSVPSTSESLIPGEKNANYEALKLLEKFKNQSDLTKYKKFATEQIKGYKIPTITRSLETLNPESKLSSYEYIDKLIPIPFISNVRKTADISNLNKLLSHNLRIAINTFGKNKFGRYIREKKLDKSFFEDTLGSSAFNKGLIPNFNALYDLELLREPLRSYIQRSFPEFNPNQGLLFGLTQKEVSDSFIDSIFKTPISFSRGEKGDKPTGVFNFEDKKPKITISDVDFNKYGKNSSITRKKYLKHYNRLALFDGLVPNFNALSSAIQRENSAGIPISQIRVGQSSNLKSNLNPLGLGVYNTKDEPLGLNQGIKRTKSMGLDPKRAGVYNKGLVPSFASSFEFESKFSIPESERKELLNRINQLKNNIKLTGFDFSKFDNTINNLQKSFSNILTPQDINRLKSSFGGLNKEFERLRKGTLRTSQEIGIEKSSKISNIAKGAQVILLPNVTNLPTTGEKILGEEERKLLRKPSIITSPPKVIPKFSISETQRLLEQASPTIPIHPKREIDRIKPKVEEFVATFINERTKKGALKQPREEVLTIPIGKTRQELQAELNTRRQTRHGFNPIAQVVPFGAVNPMQAEPSQMMQQINPALQDALRRSTINATLNDELGRTQEQAILNERKQVEFQKRYNDKRARFVSELDVSSKSLFVSDKRFKDLLSKRENVLKLTPEETSTFLQNRQARAQGIQNKALITSFVAPMIGETLAQFIRTESRTQRGLGATASGLGGAASYAALAASFGLGPVGIGTAAGFGLLTALPKIIEGFTDTLPDLQKQFERLSEKTERTSNALAGYLRVSEQLSEVYTGQTKATKGFVNQLQSQQKEFFLKLPTQNKEEFARLIKSGNLPEAIRLASNIRQQQEEEKNVVKFGIGLNQFNKQTSPFRLPTFKNFITAPTDVRRRELDFIADTDFTSFSRQPQNNIFNALIENAKGSIDFFKNLGAIGKAFAGFTPLSNKAAFSGSIIKNEKLLVEQADIFKNQLLGSRTVKGENIIDFLTQKPELINQLQGKKGEDFLNVLSKAAKEQGNEVLRSNILQFKAAGLGEAEFNKILNIVSKAFTSDELKRAKESVEAYQVSQVEVKKATDDFTQKLFESAVELESFNKTLQNSVKSTIQSFNAFIDRQKTAAAGFIDFQENFASPEVIVALKNLAANRQIQNERALGIRTAGLELGADVSQSFGKAFSTFQEKTFKEETERKRASIRKVELLNTPGASKTAFEFAAPFKQKIEEILGIQNIEEVNSALSELTNSVLKEKQVVDIKLKGDTSNDLLRIQSEFLANLFKDLTTSGLDYKFNLEKINQTLSENLSIEKLRFNQLKDQIAIQKYSTFGGGLQSLLGQGNNTIRNIIEGNTLIRGGQQRGNLLTQGQGAFQLADIFKSFGADIQKSFPSLFETIIQGTETQIKHILSILPEDVNLTDEEGKQLSTREIATTIAKLNFQTNKELDQLLKDLSKSIPLITESNSSLAINLSSSISSLVSQFQSQSGAKVFVSNMDTFSESVKNAIKEIKTKEEKTVEAPKLLNQPETITRQKINKLQPETIFNPNDTVKFRMENEFEKQYKANIQKNALDILGYKNIGEVVAPSSKSITKTPITPIIQSNFREIINFSQQSIEQKINQIKDTFKKLNDLSIDIISNIESERYFTPVKPKIAEQSKLPDVETKRQLLGFQLGRTGDLSKYEPLNEKAILAQSIMDTEELSKKLDFSKDSLKIMVASGKAFSDEIAAAVDEVNELNIKLGDFAAVDFKEAFFGPLRYGAKDFVRDFKDEIKSVSGDFKSGLSGALKDLVRGKGSIGEVFREAALNFLYKRLDFGIDQAVNQLGNLVANVFKSGNQGGVTVNQGDTTGAKVVSVIGSALASFFGKGKSGGGIIKGYSQGGLVTGGSGIKDDVPALLTEGEYVISKAAIERIKGSDTKYREEQKENRLRFIKYSEVANKPLPSLVKEFSTSTSSGINALFRNAFVYNDPRRPTSAAMQYDRRLSEFGLMDENNPQNINRLRREETFYSYIKELNDYIRMVKRTRQHAQSQKETALYTSVISAVLLGALSGLNKKGDSGTGSAGEPTGPGGSYYHPPKDIGRYYYGGLIKGYAMGGRVFGGQSPTDNIPTMLTGGEYVVKKDIVRKFGKDYFDRINYGTKKGYAEGGLVGSNVGLGINTEDISNYILKLIDITTSLRETINRNIQGTATANNNQTNRLTPQTNTEEGRGIIVNSSITINIDKNGNVNSNIDNKTNQQNNNQEDIRRNRELTKLIEAKTLETIINEKKNGGLLYDLNSRS